ncbi:MAG TPA: MarR family transcriptional regulator [Gemmatimonadota bacterium]|nr:MarR family transcriptional regulator [Gemmatimonadota bacterium]
MTGERVHLGNLLAEGADRWRDRLVETCRHAGFPEVTPTTCQVLWPLFEKDGLPISEVGQRAGMAKSSMTTIVRGLERGGFVRLESDPADHRVKRLWLTPRARELERVMGDGVTRLRHRVTATLGIAGQQQLQQNLQRLLDSL